MEYLRYLYMYFSNVTEYSFQFCPVGAKCLTSIITNAVYDDTNSSGISVKFVEI